MEHKTILITGGAGFIGSHFVNYICRKYPNYKIVNVDALTYAGDLSRINEFKSNQYQFVKLDICDRTQLEELFRKYRFDSVINFAAETHVDNSIDNPSVFVKTNIEGTFNLLNLCKKYWIEVPSRLPSTFYQISTDEVYGSTEIADKAQEDAPLSPSSIYSASKASADHLVNSFHKTYGLKTRISRSSNNYGYTQHKEKLIPKVIQAALGENHIPIYGDGRNRRDWLWVEDHCKAIDLIHLNGEDGETYNICSEKRVANIELVRQVCTILDRLHPRSGRGSYADLINFVDDRPGHDHAYHMSCSKITDTLGWRPKTGLKEGLGLTIEWHLKSHHLAD